MMRIRTVNAIICNHDLQKCSYPICGCREVNWDDLRVFLTLCREGTFAAAARSLEVNPTTVARLSYMSPVE